MPMAGVGTTGTPLSGSGPPGGNTQNSASATPNNAAAPITAKTWELSDYELQRTPQEAITDNTEIAVSPRALHSELMCPICLDMLHQTMTTKECLHRFCAECIITALRSGNKECPTCRKKLVSKRSLRPDPNFDMLISNIYPSRDEYEAQQQKALASLSKSHNQQALAHSIQVGMKAQFQVRKQVAKANAKSNPDGTESNAESANVPGQQNSGPDPAGTATPGTQQPSTASVNNGGGSGTNAATTITAPPPPNATTSAAGASKSGANNRAGTESVGENSSNTSVASDEVATEIELVFKPHPNMQHGTTTTPSSSAAACVPTEHIQTRFIKTSGNATVGHLRKYLGMRLALDASEQAEKTEDGEPKNYDPRCSIWIKPNDTFMKVSNGLTLSQVCDKYWRVNKPLEVFYFWKQT